VRATAIVLLATVPFLGAASTAQPQPTFFLCKTNVSAAQLAKAPDSQFEAVIRLTPDASRQLSDFTNGHIGEIADIRIGSELVARIAIQAHVQSGIVAVGRTSSREQVEALVARLNSLPPGLSCGPAAQQGVAADGQRGRTPT
jgi:hypothetical protein